MDLPRGECLGLARVGTVGEMTQEDGWDHIFCFGVWTLSWRLEEPLEEPEHD